MLTPASFIVINSIRVANEASQENSSDLWLYRSSAASLDKVSFVMISELNQCTASKPVKFYCRVIFVRFMNLSVLLSIASFLCNLLLPDRKKWTLIVWNTCNHDLFAHVYDRLLLFMSWFWRTENIWHQKLTPCNIFLTFHLLLLCWVSYFSSL